jgi:hypothetical protein
LRSARRPSVLEWPMVVDDLPVRAIGGGGGVGVEDEPPAVAVDAYVMVELARKYTISTEVWPSSAWCRRW